MMLEDRVQWESILNAVSCQFTEPHEGRFVSRFESGLIVCTTRSSSSVLQDDNLYHLQ